MIEKNQKNNNILLYVDIILNSNVNVRNKFYWNTDNIICLCIVYVFMMKWQSWVVATQCIWPAKHKIFTILAFTEKICWPLANRMVMLMPGYSGRFHYYDMRNWRDQTSMFGYEGKAKNAMVSRSNFRVEFFVVCFINGK